MDNPFLQAIFVQPREVLGRKLRPFSAYHAAALMLLDSPFIVPGAQGVALQDLILATHICSYGFTDGPATLFPHVDTDAINAWADSCADVDYEQEAQVFMVYLDDYLETPDIWQSDATGKEKLSGIPWPVFCVTAVLQNMRGVSESAAWDMPLNRLVAYKCAIAEQNGAEVVSQKQRNYVKWLELNAETEKDKG